jgi:hypothetical protein
MIWYSKYFSPRELLSPEGLLQYEKGNCLISKELFDALNFFRECLNSPLFINHSNLFLRGYRSIEENKTAKGANFSRHLMGMAVDVSSYSIKFEDLVIKVKESPLFTGIGIYPTKNFIHLDVGLRDKRTIWEG